MSPFRVAYPSLEFKNQLRDGVAPIQACAFNTGRHEFLTVDASALRIWSLTREVKAIMAPDRVRSSAIAAFCMEQDDTYVIVHGGRKRAAPNPTEGQPQTQTDDIASDCLVYNGRLRLLRRFNLWNGEVVATAFHSLTGALVSSEKSGALRVHHFSCRDLPPLPAVPCTSTATKGIQVTVNDTERLEGPQEPVPMELLEIDVDSGLVVGINRTDAFLWRLPASQQDQLPTKTTSSVGGVNIPRVTNTADDNSERTGQRRVGRRGRYTFVGSMPDLQSSEITAHSVREPLLTTGLATGKIFLWRINCVPGDLKWTVLCMVDAHEGFSVLSLRLLSAGSMRSSKSNDEGSQSSAPSALSSSPTLFAQPNGGGSVSASWSIISGGGDGAVSHWSVVGMAGGWEAGGWETEETGVVLRQVGTYEVRRKFSGADGGRQTAAQLATPFASTAASTTSRLPGTSLIMMGRLPSGIPSLLHPMVSVATAAGGFTGRTMQSKTESTKVDVQEVNEGTTPTKGASRAAIASGGDGARTEDCGSSEDGGGRDVCIAISGGLISIVEMVVPLWHVGWTGRRSDVLRMSRTPDFWESTTWPEGRAGGGGRAACDAFDGKYQSVSRRLSLASDGSTGEAGFEAGTAPFERRRVDALVSSAGGDEITGGMGGNNASGFLFLLEGGGLGWFRSNHHTFELISRIDLVPQRSKNNDTGKEVHASHATCFAPCPAPTAANIFRRRSDASTATASYMNNTSKGSARRRGSTRGRGGEHNKGAVATGTPLTVDTNATASPASVSPVGMVMVKSRAVGHGLSQTGTPKTVRNGSDARNMARTVVVGYSDGSVAVVAVPISVTSTTSGLGGNGEASPSSGRGAAPPQVVRRKFEPESARSRGGNVTKAGITAVCPLSAPFGLLVVAGDFDGRLSVWKMMSASPASVSPLLWEDKSAHRGPVVAIHRVKDEPPIACVVPPTSSSPAVAGASLPSPQLPHQWSREWVVSVGRGGEIRLWKVPQQWLCAARVTGVASRPVGLEFCATLLTNTSICSFSCVCLQPPRHEKMGNVERGGPPKSYEDMPCSDGPNGSQEQLCDWNLSRPKHDRTHRGRPLCRLHCTIGSESGFVQAWEASFDGEAEVGRVPLWSQKVHGAAVTTMDAYKVDSVLYGAGNTSCHDKGLRTPKIRKQRKGVGYHEVSTRCLVVSGSLDRTVCIFRAAFGQGLRLLRRLNAACSPRGSPGALIMNLPSSEEDHEGIDSMGVRRMTRGRHEVGIVLAAANGEITRLGLKFTSEGTLPMRSSNALQEGGKIGIKDTGVPRSPPLLVSGGWHGLQSGVQRGDDTEGGGGVDGKRSWVAITAGKNILDTIPLRTRSSGGTGISKNSCTHGSGRASSAMATTGTAVAAAGIGFRGDSRRNLKSASDGEHLRQKQGQRGQTSTSHCTNDENDMIGRWELSAASSEEFLSNFGGDLGGGGGSGDNGGDGTLASNEPLSSSAASVARGDNESWCDDQQQPHQQQQQQRQRQVQDVQSAQHVGPPGDVTDTISGARPPATTERVGGLPHGTTISIATNTAESKYSIATSSHPTFKVDINPPRQAKLHETLAQHTDDKDRGKKRERPPAEDGYKSRSEEDGEAARAVGASNLSCPRWQAEECPDVCNFQSAGNMSAPRKKAKEDSLRKEEAAMAVGLPIREERRDERKLLMGNCDGNHRGGRDASSSKEAWKTGGGHAATYPASTTTADGCVGDAGRWQQGLGIAVEDADDRSGSCGSGSDDIGQPSSAGNRAPISGRDLLRDASLKEAFAARGRHKTSPVLASEVKAILKAWSPGLVEACSRADFSAAMADLDQREPVDIEHVCEIAAVMISSINPNFSRRLAGPPYAVLAKSAESIGHLSKAASQGSLVPPGSRGPARPAQYFELNNCKTRLEFNNMGERVIMRTAVDSLDAFAARSRQQRTPNAGGDGVMRKGKKEELARSGAFPPPTEGLNPDDEALAGCDGILVSPPQESNDVASDQRTPLNVTKSLGFGWPDFSSVGSRIAEELDREDDSDCIPHPSRAMAACLGTVPAGFRNVWSRQGSRLFHSWAASHEELSQGALAAGTAGGGELIGEGECIRIVRGLLDAEAAAAAAARVVCRRRNRCPHGAHSLVITDDIERVQGYALMRPRTDEFYPCHDRSSTPATNSATTPSSLNVPTLGGQEEGRDIARQASDEVDSSIMTMTKAAPSNTLGVDHTQERTDEDEQQQQKQQQQFDIRPMRLRTQPAPTSSSSSDPIPHGAGPTFFAVHSEEDEIHATHSTTPCPAANPTPVGTTLYKEFRRRYGIQRTTEERVAGLVGSVLEHMHTSSVLRLFIRIAGAPADATGEGRWPCQTQSEDRKQGLEPEFARLVITARNWLIVRGFMTMDGPWVGGRGNGKEVGDPGGVLQRSARPDGADGGRCGIGWPRAIVSRTHAAMCATDMIRQAWGGGQRIMDVAEQAILRLPTVQGSKGWRKDGDQERESDPWSQLVDAEAFLEALLLLVLEAKVMSHAAVDRLFGPAAVADYPFVLARARDINVSHDDERLIGTSHHEGGGFLHDILREKKQTTSPKNLGEGKPLSDATADVLTATTSATAPDINHATTGPTKEHESVLLLSDQARNEWGPDDNDSRADGEIEKPKEEKVSGASIGGLVQLKPLLDNFIQADTQRTGTLPAADFHRILCDGHGGLWSDVPAHSRARGALSRECDAAMDFVDLRLTSAQNEAARALVGRFMDVFDGHVCYLDLWITLYHAVFRSGKVTPFVDLPTLCESQLRGADSQHWGAALEYLQAIGGGGRRCLSRNDAEQGHDAHPRDRDVRRDTLAGSMAGAYTNGVGEGEALCRQGQRSATASGGVPSVGGADTMGWFAKGPSAPALGVLRTAVEGGASSSHTISDMSEAETHHHLPGGDTGQCSTGSTRGVAPDWPQAGWGPGSLTVSRPPALPGPPGTAVSPAAALWAMSVVQEADTRATRCKIDKAVMTARSPEGILHLRSSEGGNMGASSSAGDLNVTCLTSVSGEEAASGINAAASSHNPLSPATRKTTEHNRRDGDADDGCYSGDEPDQSEEGAFLYNLDCGTLEPPSPEPPSLRRRSADWAGDAGGVDGAFRQSGRRRREKRTMTSLYVRCPFLDPVRSTFAYRVPKRSGLTVPTVPVSHVAADQASMAAQLYSSIKGAKARKAIHDASIGKERRHRGDADSVIKKSHKRPRGEHGGRDPTREDTTSALQFPPSLKETMMREGRSKSREKRSTNAGVDRPGPGGGGGRHAEGASLAAAEDRQPWTGQRQKMKSLDGIASVLDSGEFILAGVATGERVISPPASRGASRERAATPNQSRGSHSPDRTRPLSPPANTKPDTQARTINTTQPVQMPSSTGNADLTTGSRGGRGGMKGRKEHPRRGGGRRGRRGSEARGGRHDRSDDDDEADGPAGGAITKVDPKKAAQQKMVEAMMAEQAAKRRASGETMKRLIAEEEDRKRLKKDEEEAAKRAQEQAKQEMEERQRRELEERRKALALKKVEVEEKQRQLEEERLRREEKRKLADQARREQKERLRQEAAEKHAEATKQALEKEIRLKEAEEERLRDEEEVRERVQQKAVETALRDKERARETGEREKMARHDEDIDTIIQADLSATRETERSRKAAEAAQRVESLRAAAEVAKRKQACMLMSNRDEESRLSNVRWKRQEEEEEEAERVRAEKAEPAATTFEGGKKSIHVIFDESGNPSDIKLWEIECTVETDTDGRIVQREAFGADGGYMFDPRDVFTGEGGGIGGRGGRRGDGTTRQNSARADKDDVVGDVDNDSRSQEEEDISLDAKGLLERERRWLEAILAASRPEDLSSLFQDSHKMSPDEFFPMVLNERVAWPEFMGMARAALFKNADASDALCNSPKNSPLAAEDLPAMSTGVNASLGRLDAESDARATNDEDARGHATGDTSLGSRPTSSAPNSCVGATASAKSSCQGGETNGQTETTEQTGTTELITASGKDYGATAKVLTIGRTCRGIASADRNSWLLFRFDLPAIGPVLTTVLDPIDSDMELFVSRGGVPTAPAQITAGQVKMPPTAELSSATATGVTAAPTFTSDWEGFASKIGKPRVVKILPQDPSYGAGTYYVAVVPTGVASRFALRVSTAAPEDEISKHMRVAAAVVDNLTIMSAMDPHRLVKDFAGARLEAEETLREQRAAVDSICSIDHLRGGSLRDGKVPVDGVGGHEPQEEQRVERGQPTVTSRHPLLKEDDEVYRAPESTVSSPYSSLPHSGDRNPHGQPSIGIASVETTATRREGIASKPDMTTSATSVPQESTTAMATATNLTAGIPTTTACATNVNGVRDCSLSLQDEGGEASPRNSPVLSALRHREQILTSGVAVLDDRMARVRPTSVLGAVSGSGITSMPSPLLHPSSSPGSGSGSSGPATRPDVLGGLGHLGDSGGDSGKASNPRDNYRTGADTFSRFMPAGTMVSSTPHQIRHGLRRRRLSVPLMPTSVDGGGVRQDACGAPLTDGLKRTRPWTTSGFVEVAQHSDEGKWGSRSAADILPFRYSVRCLDHACSEEIRLNDLRFRKTASRTTEAGERSGRRSRRSSARGSITAQGTYDVVSHLATEGRDRRDRPRSSVPAEGTSRSTRDHDSGHDRQDARAQRRTLSAGSIGSRDTEHVVSFGSAGVVAAPAANGQNYANIQQKPALGFHPEYSAMGGDGDITHYKGNRHVREANKIYDGDTRAVENSKSKSGVGDGSAECFRFEPAPSVAARLLLLPLALSTETSVTRPQPSSSAGSPLRRLSRASTAGIGTNSADGGSGRGISAGSSRRTVTTKGRGHLAAARGERGIAGGDEWQAPARSTKPHLFPEILGGPSGSAEHGAGERRKGLRGWLASE